MSHGESVVEEQVAQLGLLAVQSDGEPEALGEDLGWVVQVRISSSSTAP
jgi:hypothetical protein